MLSSKMHLREILCKFEKCKYGICEFVKTHFIKNHPCKTGLCEGLCEFAKFRGILGQKKEKKKAISGGIFQNLKSHLSFPSIPSTPSLDMENSKINIHTFLIILSILIIASMDPQH